MRISNILGILCVLTGGRGLAGSVVVTQGSLLPRASAAELSAANKIVQDAISKMTVLNKARLQNPARNRYKAKPGGQLGRGGDDGAPPPLLEITPEIAAAAALLSEQDTTAAYQNRTSQSQLRPRDASFWMEGITRKGTVPWGSTSGYAVRT